MGRCRTLRRLGFPSWLPVLHCPLALCRLGAAVARNLRCGRRRPKRRPVPPMNRVRFFLGLMREHALSYLGGIAALGATLWMTVLIPGYLQQAIDILGNNPDPTGREFLNRILWILGFAFAIIGTRTASRLLF